ncbi:MAG: hypothetical protein PHP42_06870 [Bacteroidota bacterium]|nr:hypothetical protein [Bacteroidota bacterium]
MPDQIIFTIAIAISVISVVFGSAASYLAYKNSKKVETEIRMVFWGIGAIAGFVFGALCWAWFLIPIILNHI